MEIVSVWSAALPAIGDLVLASIANQVYTADTEIYGAAAKCIISVFFLPGETKIGFRTSQLAFLCQVRDCLCSTLSQQLALLINRLAHTLLYVLRPCR